MADDPNDGARPIAGIVSTLKAMLLPGDRIRASAVAGLGLLAWAGTELVRVRQGKHGSARWLAKDLNVVDRSARRALRWKHFRLADRLSDALAIAGIPALCAWALSDPGEGLRTVLWRDGYAVTEAAVITGLANQLTKQVALRERPLAKGRALRKRMGDRYGSFFSGHSSSAAVVCAATAIRRLRQGRPSARLWLLPILPVVVGYLRVAADKHYLTDVLAGLGVGAAFGALSGLAPLDAFSVAGDVGIDLEGPGVDPAL